MMKTRDVFTLLVLFTLIGIPVQAQVMGSLTLDPVKRGVGTVWMLDTKWTPVLSYETGKYPGFYEDGDGYSIGVSMDKFGSGALFRFDQEFCEKEDGSDQERLKYLGLMVCRSYYDKEVDVYEWSVEGGLVVTFGRLVSSVWIDPLNFQGRIGFGYRFLD